MNIQEVLKNKANISIQKKVVLSIMYSHLKVMEKLSEVFKPYDLSPEQFNVLRILRGQYPDLAQMSLVQERMLTKNSNTTRLIDKLLLKKLVTRKVNEQNRRIVLVGITEAGLELLQELDKKVDIQENTMTKNLTEEELETINLLLEKLRD